MATAKPGEALPDRRPTPEAIAWLYAYARQEWRPLLRTRDPERRWAYVASCLRVFAFVRGFDLFEDEVAAVQRAVSGLRRKK